MTDTLLPVDLPTATSPTPVTTPVSAVVVTHGLTPYLPTTLEALAAQTRRPVRVLLVDVSDGTDDLGHLLHSAFAAVQGTPAVLRVVHAPGARTFGHAVRRALDADDGPATSWLWLLHDDSAPAPTALSELVRAVGRARSVGVAGVKQRTWTDPERLLEVGLRTSRSGRRMTDVEPGELDQGQHDGRDDVLGVGIVGALVRRDVWDELGGTDPLLGPFGDGFDLSRRARLAGHRVVVVPSAVVRHAQAGYLGLRSTASGAGEPVDVDGDGEDDRADPRRSFAARRRALVHSRLVAAPLPLLPVVVVFALLAAVVRALCQLAVKQPGMAVDEVRAALGALARPDGILRARRRAARSRRMPRRDLRPLQAGWRDVWSQAHDRRLARAEARRVVQAPSELELRELAALATRRRTVLAAVVGVLVLTVGSALGALLGPVAGGASLVGDALLPASARLGELWSTATSGWVAGGLGGPGPADALLTMLAAPTALVGGSTSAAVAVLLLGSVVLAGVGAWAAAGAATRSVGVRAWAAVVWAGAPVLLLSLGDGRLGGVLAHVALPWLALGLARAVGVQRVDQVLSGVATAQRQDGVTELEVETPVRGTPTVPTPRVSGDVPAVVEPAPARVGAPDPTGSITAAAAASIAFAFVVAGAPVLLVPGILALCVVALCAPRGRGRVLLVAVPALALLGPTLVEAAGRGLAGWRLLVADPGLQSASDPAGPVSRLLGVPADASSLVPDGLPPVLAQGWPLALGAVVLLLAGLALLRGAPVSRAVRGAWIVAALGAATATLVVAIPVTVSDGVVVHGWAGPPLSLAGAGLLTAAVIGADQLRVRLAHYTFGWRQPVVALVTAVAVVVPVAWLGTWTWQARSGDAVGLRSIERAIVPAVGRQAQVSDLSSRVLTVSLEPSVDAEVSTVTWQLMRGDGPQLVDQAASGSTRALSGDLLTPDPTAADAATLEVDALVARLATAATGDVAGELAALAVADVVVPPVPDDLGGVDPQVAQAQRDELVSRLDSTAGLERVTQNATGTLWRVQATAAVAGGQAPSVVPAWARVVPVSADVTDPTVPVVPVASRDRTVDTALPAGDAARLLVLAERADPHWHAWLDGRPLRAVEGGWRQTFALGADGGDLEVRYDSPDRTPWLAVQGLVALVTLLLAAPVRRRRGVRT
ncbi:glycosyltransferase [Cellulomonas fengjieae]|uniref:Glycosyltransferase family 2 protein n=1 Tax=Cellulomonas fengjieae TaxID=2819978 RepID=A0ABS3SDZ3_9CELL|nr:glycosyltransferase [Cellulomonas fengjieae]MBO3083867.1 glycosyltransferase family 2 protein [Cellulomonas fengjieae]QVI64848.1 glycosyltransferase family 2 protein [Cellulomonas fengjieae]